MSIKEMYDFIYDRAQEEINIALAWGTPALDDAEKVYDDVWSVNLSATYGPNEPTTQKGFGPGDLAGYGAGEDQRIPYDVYAHIKTQSPRHTINVMSGIQYTSVVAVMQGNEDILYALAEPWVMHPDYDRIFEPETN